MLAGKAGIAKAELDLGSTARLAQSVERKALNLVVVGSSPTVGVYPIESAGMLFLWAFCPQSLGMQMARHQSARLALRSTD